MKAYTRSPFPQLTFKSGSVIFGRSAEEPDRFRGPQFHRVWGDEFAAWRYGEEAWSNIELGLRLGDRPQAVLTSTPRPIKLLNGIINDPMTIISRGSTYDNQKNLPPSFLRRIRERYEGTRLGRQELFAEVLDDVPGALWSHAIIDAARAGNNGIPAMPPDLVEVVVAIDPAATSGEEANESGIVAAGRDAEGHGWVLGDHSIRGTPNEVVAKALAVAELVGADRIIAETNNGGEWIKAVVRAQDPNISYRAVTASRGKMRRAEPVSALYEQGRVHHVGTMGALEDQMATYVPAEVKNNDSPDRMDALVWALTDLMVTSKRVVILGGTDEDLQRRSRHRL